METDPFETKIDVDLSFKKCINALRDPMSLLFEILASEPDFSVRAILGHTVFINIYPYMDGNGRIGRFMMNVMISSGGYALTVNPVERRTKYMHCVERAIVIGDIIIPFAKL